LLIRWEVKPANYFAPFCLASAIIHKDYTGGTSWAHATIRPGKDTPGGL
jgi:hypothetical protein